MGQLAAMMALALTVFGAASGCGRLTSSTDSVSASRNEALVRRWIDDGFNKRSLAVVDELFANGFTVNGNVIGRDGVRQSMRRYLDAFHDLHVTINDLVADGKRVAILYTADGTHSGQFEGIGATGRHVTWIGSDLFYLEAEKITSALFLSDLSSLLAQLRDTPRSEVRP